MALHFRFQSNPLFFTNEFQELRKKRNRYKKIMEERNHLSDCGTVTSYVISQYGLFAATYNQEHSKNSA
jgi:hypothetical protein